MASQLTPDELDAALETLPGWEVLHGMLTKVFRFETYREGLDFAHSVGLEADRQDHHPNLLIEYKKVEVSTVSHDAGGLTARDIALARAVDALAP